MGTSNLPYILKVWIQLMINTHVVLQFEGYASEWFNLYLNIWLFHGTSSVAEVWQGTKLTYLILVVETEISAPVITKFDNAMILNQFQPKLIMKIVHSPVVIFDILFHLVHISLIIWGLF